jgi:hypothetical protein
VSENQVYRTLPDQKSLFGGEQAIQNTSDETLKVMRGTWLVSF